MKSTLFLLLLVTIISTSALAQFSLGGHVNALFPIGDFSNRTEGGFGFDVEGRFGVEKTLMTSASIGYHSFSSQGVGN
ncbi:MAG: hypothetical protein WBA23_00185, partial [Tunicatimonas sp.]|uniref:hypothetical protein n=1 Tax=Tunicatimonas sp. TaxID=1940096 RepID=UPI003C7425B6